jgi:acetyl esterase
VIRSYRKLIPVAYGEPRPEAVIQPALAFDTDHPAECRAQLAEDSIRRLRAAWAERYCYPQMAAVETADQQLDRAGARIPIRVYRAARRQQAEGVSEAVSGASAAGSAVLVYFHGGAFSHNNADVYDDVYRYLAAFEGLTVVAVDYRLAPENRFPIGVEDAYAGLCWAADRLAQLADGSTVETTGKLLVGGDSSGGNFAAATCLMARDRCGPRVDGQVWIYPLVVFRPDRVVESEQRYGKGYFLEYTSDDSELDFYFDNPDQADSCYASPLGAKSLSALPPTVIISAECDPLLDQALWYAARLQDEGVPVEYSLKRGMLHGFFNRPYRETIDAFELIGRFAKQL